MKRVRPTVNSSHCLEKGHTFPEASASLIASGVEEGLRLKNKW